MSVAINFEGKAAVADALADVPTRRLVEDPARGYGDVGGNMVLHADNLAGLKALLPEFAGRVQCVYIDPPYYIAASNFRRGYDDGERIPAAERAAAWLRMMWPRLLLLRKMLTADGVIWVSIDDRRKAHCRMMLDEIFGERQYVGEVIWRRGASANSGRGIGRNHETLLVYAMAPTWRRNKLPRDEALDQRLAIPDEQGRMFVPGALSGPTHGMPRGNYPVVNPTTGEGHWPPRGRVWGVAPDEMSRLVDEGRVWFGANGTGRPKRKRFLGELDGLPVPSVWDVADVGASRRGTQELFRLFPDVEEPFRYSKPRTLLERIIHLSTGPEDIVLDCFAGSGTTGHATLSINKADGGYRRFVLVEQEDYADTLTAERIRRAIAADGLPGGIEYATLGDVV